MTVNREPRAVRGTLFYRDRMQLFIFLPTASRTQSIEPAGSSSPRSQRLLRLDVVIEGLLLAKPWTRHQSHR